MYPIAPSLTSQYRCRRGAKKNDQVDDGYRNSSVRTAPLYPTLQNSRLCE